MEAHQEINCNEDTPDAMMEIDDEPMKLLDLNEDYLRRILSLKSLRLVDLSSLAETCTLLKRLISDIFPNDLTVRFSLNKNAIKLEYGCGKYSNYYRSLKEFERILKNFGSRISTLLIFENSPDFMNLIAKYCSGTLKRLAIYTNVRAEDIKIEHQPIYQQLQSLSLIWTDRIINTAFLQLNCDSLTEFEFERFLPCDAILMNRFPNLQRFKFDGQLGPLNAFYDFLDRHRGLRALTLKTTFSEDRNNNILSEILKSCTGLVELALKNVVRSNSQLDVSILQNLLDLKMLHIYNSGASAGIIIQHLDALQSLEMVKLTCGELFQNYDDRVPLALSQLQNLRELHLMNWRFQSRQWSNLNQLRTLKINQSETYYGTELPNIISQLTNLEELEIGVDKYIFAISERVFYEMVETVERTFELRSNVLTIKFEFIFSEAFLQKCIRHGKVKLIKL